MTIYKKISYKFILQKETKFSIFTTVNAEEALN